MGQKERRIWMIRYLLAERGIDVQSEQCEIPAGEREQCDLPRALVNVREPEPIDETFLSVESAYLQERLREINVTDSAGISVQLIAPRLGERNSGIAVWQGDITTLQCDAIVNAANSGMTGCCVPNHYCIDNVIHTVAGMRLRLECSRIMRSKGRPEPIGAATITPGCELPSRYVLHTVGPAIQTADPIPTEQDRSQLESCYLSCLEVATEHSLETLAFCSISTGVFRCPIEEAANIAVLIAVPQCHVRQ